LYDKQFWQACSIRAQSTSGIQLDLVVQPGAFMSTETQRRCSCSAAPAAPTEQCKPHACSHNSKIPRQPSSCRCPNGCHALWHHPSSMVFLTLASEHAACLTGPARGLARGLGWAWRWARRFGRLRRFRGRPLPWRAALLWGRFGACPSNNRVWNRFLLLRSPLTNRGRADLLGFFIIRRRGAWAGGDVWG